MSQWDPTEPDPYDGYFIAGCVCIALSVLAVLVLR